MQIHSRNGVMEYNMSKLIEQLREKRNLTDEQLKELIETDGYDKELFASAVDIREKAYGRDVYIRGLIEISSYCKNDCYYCGIRRSNEKAQRYRLSEEEILECCVTGYDLGFRTFVLQGGEDPYFTDERICDIVGKIKKGLCGDAFAGRKVPGKLSKVF